MADGDAAATSKRQKIVHLSTEEWGLQRPSVILGSMAKVEMLVADFAADGTVEWRTVTVCPGLVTLANELFANALDNCARDGTQRYIKADWRDGALHMSNDGSAVPVERVGDEWAPTLAFFVFQSGSNFDDASGRKDVATTVGQNGLGFKACVLFSDKTTVSLVSYGRTFLGTARNNMKVLSAPVIGTSARKTNETRVEWTPDLPRLGGEDAPMELLCRMLAHNAALCAPPSVKVFFGGVPIKLRTPEQFCRAMGAEGRLASDTVDGRMRLCVGACAEERVGENGGGRMHVFVNGTRCPEGTHVRHLVQRVCDLLAAKLRSKRGAPGDVHVPPAFVRNQAIVVATFVVDGPRFTDQTKTCLDSPVREFGWRWETSDAFRTALEASPLVERARRAAQSKEDAAAARATKASVASTRGIAKYDAATRLGKGDATLLVTEGDSAKNFAVAGLSVVGRAKFGVYPLKGKFVNLRGKSAKAVLEHKEAKELLQILGLQLGTTYDAAAARRLPYSRLMVLSDQDVDGSHIAGLLFNFLDVCAPSLLAAKPDFLCRFATSLIRVDLKGSGGEVGFYSEGEYETWRADRLARGLSVGTPSFFKGLGTSSATRAKAYFRDLTANSIVVRHTGRECAEALDRVFHKGRAEDRRAFLAAHVGSRAFVDYSRAETTVTRFLEDELLPQYATASIVRAIPSVVDGFKESHRKVFFGMRALGITSNLSVGCVAGKVSGRTHYHHRATAMEDTIVHMAADYAGAGNLNLLVPDGQFGDRHDHTAASAAYPKTRLHAPLHELLYPPADDAVLVYREDEGVSVEPVHYVPVLPAVLCYGGKGVATGWSTDVPPFKPLDVLDASIAHLDGRPLPALVPWYRGFGGTVEAAERNEEAFVVRGTCEVRDNGEIHVTEVPPVKETDAYREAWQRAGTEVRVGDQHTDVAVHLVLRGGVSVDQVRKDLEARVGVGNMHLLDASGTLHRYTVDRVVREHAEARLALYDRRLAHLVAKAERESTVAENRARFVDAWVDGSFDMRAHPDDASAAAACAGLGLAAVDGSYDYLLSMPGKSLTAARAAALRETARKAREALAVLRADTPEALWRRELARLRAHLESAQVNRQP